ncbi:PIN domain-containing protein [Staphylothermus hellenicus]|uniref:PIN domain-containing protein n=1 Tax=Staphylothermus hellenicus TaxID=84599 RepID=UPI0001C47754
MKGALKYPLLGEIYKPLATAIKLSTQLNLRTLDMLHVSYAKLLRNQGEHVRKIVTADTDFEKVADKIRKLINLDVELIS